jgi:hypothetical protein
MVGNINEAELEISALIKCIRMPILKWHAQVGIFYRELC